MPSHDLHAVFINSICTPVDYLNYGKTIQTQSVTDNCQVCEYSQDVKMLTLENVRQLNECRVTSVYTILYSNYAIFFGEMMRAETEKPHASLSSHQSLGKCATSFPGCPTQRRLMNIFPSHPAPASTQNWTSQQRKPLQLLFPPQGSKWVHSVICCCKMLQIEPTQN